MNEFLLKRRMMMLNSNQLPDEYVELQYIECTGEQYALLTFPPIGAYNDLIVEANWNMLGNPQNCTIYGYRAIWPGSSKYNHQLIANNNYYWIYGTVSGTISDTSIPKVSINITTNTWYKSIQDVDGVILNNVEYSYNKTGGGVNFTHNTFALGALYDSIGRSVTNSFIGYLGEINITATSYGRVFKLKPVLGPNNEVGFYDLISKEFITSATEVPFIAGPIK